MRRVLGNGVGRWIADASPWRIPITRANAYYLRLNEGQVARERRASHYAAYSDGFEFMQFEWDPVVLNCTLPATTSSNVWWRGFCAGLVCLFRPEVCALSRMVHWICPRSPPPTLPAYTRILLLWMDLLTELDRLDWLIYNDWQECGVEHTQTHTHISSAFIWCRCHIWKCENYATWRKALNTHTLGLRLFRNLSPCEWPETTTHTFTTRTCTCIVKQWIQFTSQFANQFAASNCVNSFHILSLRHFG